MHRVLTVIDAQAESLASAPFFTHLQDKSKSAAERLAFVTGAAHFVMSFADLYAAVLTSEPTDEYQKLVNEHTKEDETHWQWFLSDLEKMGYTNQLSFTDALRLLWSPVTLRTRMLSYEMCRLGMGASSLKKLALVHVIEAAGKVTVGRVAEVGGEYEREHGVKLIYLGPHHRESEAAHTVEQVDVRQRIASIPLTDDQAAEFSQMAVDGFGFFRGFIDDMYGFVQSDQVLTPSSPRRRSQ